MKILKSIAGGSFALITFGTVVAWSADNVAQIRQSGNISYTSGGVSDEGRSAFAAIAGDFNLKLVFASKSGDYLSDIDVVVSTGRGQPVLEARSEGPWFFARLPNGKYMVTATSNGRSLHRTVTVESRNLRTLDFRWDSLDGIDTARR